MKMIILIFVALILFSSEELLLQDIPDCMCPPLSYPPTGQPTNLDSACVIDTCGIQYKYSNCDSAYWYNLESEFGEQTKKRVYSKGFWEILFKVPAIPVPAASKEDTIIYVDWTDIDTTYPEIRNTFQQMEEDFGDLYFRKLSPTADENAKSFRLYFTNYVNVDSITTIGRQISDIIVFDFARWPYRSPEYKVEDDNLEFISNIYPNPAQEYIDFDINFTSIILTQYIHERNEMRIYNVKGEEVQSKTINVNKLNNKLFKVKIDISKLNSGIYYVKFYNQYEKLIIFR